MSTIPAERLDRLFRALGDPTRRRIVERLREHPGSTTGELAMAIRGISRYGVMKHVGVLREAGVVQTLPEGRHRRHYRVDRALDPLRDWLGDR